MSAARVSESRRGKAAAWAVLAPPLLLALYLLGLIPVALSGGFRNPPPDSGLRRVYAPLRWAYENTPLRRPLHRYGEFLGRLEMNRPKNQ